MCDRISENQPFDTLNISSSNKALHSTIKSACIINYQKSFEIFYKLLLWQHCKVLGSIYSKSDKVVDFQNSGHISYAYSCRIHIGLLIVCMLLTQHNSYTDTNLDGVIRTLRDGLSYSVLQ